MSRSSATGSGVGRRGGVLVDCGDWDKSPAPRAAPVAAAVAADPVHPASSLHSHGQHSAHAPRTAAAAPSAPSQSKAPAPARAAAPPSSSSSSFSAAAQSATEQWLHSQPEIIAADKTSDRPLYCLSVNERLGSFVVGGADHSLRVYDLRTATMRRELYSKQSGHTEWVCSCACLPDGRVLSGGMDGKVVLWDSSGTRGQDLLAHTGSVSRVMVDARDVGLSAGYDRTMRLWNLAPRAAGSRELGVLKGIGGAVTACDWHNSLALSGTREGQVGLWDVNTCQRVRWLTSAAGQGGQILTLQLGSAQAGVSATDDASRTHPAVHPADVGNFEWLVAAGGSDGFLRLYDLRTETCVLQRRLSEGQPGSVNDVSFSTSGRVVTALADGALRVLDARAGWRSVSNLRGHRSPVTTCRVVPGTGGEVAVSTGSNGWLCVHDLRPCEDTGHAQPQPLEAAYAIGITTVGGVNALWVGEGGVAVAAGDDGQPVVLRI